MNIAAQKKHVRFALVALFACFSGACASVPNVDTADSEPPVTLDGGDGGTGAGGSSDSACKLSEWATLPEWDAAPPPFLPKVYDPVAASDKYPNELDKGTDLQRLELSAADALCNDGTHAQLYVRPATAGNEKKWVLYLQGGGGCGGYDDCLSRWQGTQDGGYDATKMSTRYNPDTALAEGIFERSTRNPVSGWNHVYFYSCSSDSFSGTSPNAILFDPANAAAKPYSLYFLGRRILEGALDQLRDGAVATLKDSPGVVPYRMPALKDAEMVLLTGSSGGAAAVRRNVDWLGAKLGPSVKYAAIAEATISTPKVRYGGEQGANRDECEARNDYLSAIHPNNRRTAFDESCQAAHEKTGDVWQCFDTHHVLHHHLTTPMMLRQDLTDPKAGDIPKLIGLTEAQWVTIQNEYFQTLVNRTEFSHTPESITRAPSFFAPNCGAHIVFHKDWYYSHKIKSGGAEISMNDAVTRWLKEEAPFYMGDLNGTSSVCTK